MAALALIITEDTLAVLGFVIFAVLVYYLIGIAFHKYSGTKNHKKVYSGPFSFLNKNDREERGRKNFSKNVITGSSMGGNNFYENEL